MSYVQHHDHGGTNPRSRRSNKLPSPQPARRLSPQENSKRKNNDYTREGTCLALRPWQDELAIATLKHITLSTGSKARSTDDDNHTKNHDSTANNTKTTMTRSSTFPWHKIEIDRYINRPARRHGTGMGIDKSCIDKYKR